MEINLEEYKRTGYTIIKDAIPQEDLKIAQHETLKLKRWFNIFNKLGQPKDYGTGEYWKGIELAGILSKPLKKLYTSKRQYDLAIQFLETKDIYLFMKILDEKISSINSDYEAKRSNNLILNAPKLTIVKNGVFYNCLKQKNKLDDQNKIKRLNENRDFIEEIKKINS